MNEVAIIARVILGVVFVWAGISKLRTPHWSLLAIEAGTPRPVVLTLPAFESVLGLALLLQVAVPFIPWLAVLVMFGFTATVVHRLVSGSKAPCNCFGGKSNDPVDRSTVVRNLVLLVIALLATR